MPRLGHGAAIGLSHFRAASERLAERSADVNLAFAAATPTDPTRFGYLFDALQSDPSNLLPTASSTPAHLKALGRAMRDTAPFNTNNAPIPSAYTYFGQFVDHDITLETQSATTGQLLDPGLVPMTTAAVHDTLFNLRTATLDLDCVYAFPAPRVGQRMKIGNVTALGAPGIPTGRPAGKADDNDLPREPRSGDPAHDRAALIGDPRNDENTIVAQLQVAFLKAHNALVDRGHAFGEARRMLRQHYQHVVLHDYLKRIADPGIVDGVVASGPTFYKAMEEPFFLPLEFSVAAYRFGHSLVRAAYDFNVNFNVGGPPAVPADLSLLFTFTALTGQLGFPGQDSDTLPENWIIEWERFFPAGANLTRRIDTHLVEPLFELRNTLGQPESDGGDDARRLAVRNLLRGYLLRIPTGQAVASALGLPIMTPAQVEAAADDATQAQVLRDSGLNARTPLWYYVLAEANHAAAGAHLGPVGSTLLAEVFVGLVQRSEDSILRTPYWKPTLGSTPGTFELPDLLRLAGVLSTPTEMTRSAGGRR